MPDRLTGVVSDDAIASAIAEELDRQQTQIELIASENIVSPDVPAAQGSVLTNKCAEGYPGNATMAAASSSTRSSRWRCSPATRADR